MRIRSVLASIGITAALVCTGSVLTGIGTRNRRCKRQNAINRLYQPNQISCDVVQIRKKAKEFSNINAQYQNLQLSTYEVIKREFAEGQDGAKLIRRVTNN